MPKDKKPAHRFGERWFAEGCNVFDENRILVVSCSSPEDAALIANAPLNRDIAVCVLGIVNGEQNADAWQDIEALYVTAGYPVIDYHDAEGEPVMRLPQFAHLSDEALAETYDNAMKRLKKASAALNNENLREPADTDESLKQALTENEAHLSALESELSAREMHI